MTERTHGGNEKVHIAQHSETSEWYLTNCAVILDGPFPNREAAVRAREELRARDEQEARSQFVGVPSNHIEI